jgi:hypothetical protein
VLTGTVKELTAGMGYRLSAADVPERLHEALRALGAGVAVRNGFTDFHFPTREQANAGIDALRGQRCTIESITPTTSTLEEVFVKAVEGASEERPQARSAP